MYLHPNAALELVRLCERTGSVNGRQYDYPAQQSRSETRPLEIISLAIPHFSIYVFRRRNARGSERVYGRIGSYFEYNLTKDKPLRVQYRIWIQEGEMTVDQCEAMSRAFTEPVTVVVK